MANPTDTSVNILATGGTPVDGQLVDTGAGTNLFRQRAMLQQTPNAGDAIALKTIDLTTLAALNNTPTADRLRTAQGASDGWNGLGLLGVAQYLDNPNGTFDHARSLAASGYGLGAALKANAANQQALNINASTLTGSFATILTGTNEQGVRQRGWLFFSSSNQPWTCSFAFQLGSTIGGQSFLQLTVAAGSNGWYIDSQGQFFLTAGVLPTIAAGAVAQLKSAAATLLVQAKHNGVAPTSGVIQCDYIGTH